MIFVSHAVLLNCGRNTVQERRRHHVRSIGDHIHKKESFIPSHFSKGARAVQDFRPQSGASVLPIPRAAAVPYTPWCIVLRRRDGMI